MRSRLLVASRDLGLASHVFGSFRLASLFPSCLVSSCDAHHPQPSSSSPRPQHSFSTTPCALVRRHHLDARRDRPTDRACAVAEWTAWLGLARSGARVCRLQAVFAGALSARVLVGWLVGWSLGLQIKRNNRSFLNKDRNGDFMISDKVSGCNARVGGLDWVRYVIHLTGDRHLQISRAPFLRPADTAQASARRPARRDGRPTSPAPSAICPLPALPPVPLCLSLQRHTWADPERVSCPCMCCSLNPEAWLGG